MCWIYLEHACKQFFELLTEIMITFRLVFAVCPPENVSSVASYAFVIWVLSLCRRKWWMLRHHDKENHGCGKQIDLFSLVRCFQVDFWRHVIESTQFRVQETLAISSLYWSGKAEVSNLQVKILANKQVFWFEIAMRDLVLVAKVEAGHELLEVVSCLILLKWS